MKSDTMFQEDCWSNRATISRTAALSSGSRSEQIRETLVHTSVDLALKMFSMAQDLDTMNESYVLGCHGFYCFRFRFSVVLFSPDIARNVGVKSIATTLFIKLWKRLQLISSDDGINRIGIQAYSSLKLIATAVAALGSQDIKIGYNRQIPMNNMDFPASMMVLTGGELLHWDIDISESGAASYDLEILSMISLTEELGFGQKMPSVCAPRRN